MSECKPIKTAEDWIGYIKRYKQRNGSRLPVAIAVPTKDFLALVNDFKQVCDSNNQRRAKIASFDNDYCLKSEADAVIADLQKTNVMLADNAVKLNRELDELKIRTSCTFSDDCLRVRHLKRENEQLKAKLESVQASMYCDVVDANMENRRLKRALYKACANWMINKQAFLKSFEFPVRAEKFYKAIEKCLKKAEEYK